MHAAVRIGALPAPLFAAFPALAADENWGRDAPGGSDLAPNHRLRGFWLIGHRGPQWEQTGFPIGPAVAKRGHRDWLNSVSVEGEVTRAYLRAPRGKSPLEVHRNCEQVLSAAGFKALSRCELKCDDLYFGMDDTSRYAPASNAGEEGRSGNRRVEMVAP